jgi:hypothetical protein
MGELVPLDTTCFSYHFGEALSGMSRQGLLSLKRFKKIAAGYPLR